MLIFRHQSDPAVVAAEIAKRIKRRLAVGIPTLWQVAGGSAVPIAATVSHLLQGTPLQHLTVTLTDERFGPVGHADSNWEQLKLAGFELAGAELVPVLSGADIEQTAKQFGDNLATSYDRCRYRLGFFGIGPDGHTAGILPETPAVSAPGYATSYDGGRYQRVTMTFDAVRRLDEAIVYAVGETKWPVLDQLHQELPLAKQPAQILKSVPQTIIFNDHEGDSPKL